MHSIRTLLESCWAVTPSIRPTFDELLVELELIITECKEIEDRAKIFDATNDVVATVRGVLATH